MGLTFSRSAWLALVAYVVILFLKSKHLERNRLLLLIATIALVMTLTLYPLRDFVFARVSNSNISTEQISTVGRSWLTNQALDMIRQHPLMGVGIGSFVVDLSKRAPEGAPIEPVHNIVLLLTAELGIIAFVLLMGLFVCIAKKMIPSKSPRAILAGASLAGLGVIALFDHYLLTLAPGRMMLALALGLWSGQVVRET
jgi:O-antigen ligase